MFDRSRFYTQVVVDTALKGELATTPSIGYKLQQCTCSKGLIVDEEMKQYVIDAFNIYATGQFSLVTLLGKLEQLHGIKRTPESLRNILKNKFYIGFQVIKGKEYPHNYPCFIDEATWFKVQSVLSGHKKSKVKYAGIFFLFRGLIKCGICGAAAYGERHKNNNYYCCAQARLKRETHTKGRSYMSEKLILDQVRAITKDLKVNWVELVNYPEKMRLFVSKALSAITLKDKQITCTLNDDANDIDFNTYIQTGMVPLMNREDKDLSDYLYEPKSIEEIAHRFNLNLLQAQHKIFDLHLNNKVEQDHDGLWKLVG